MRILLISLMAFSMIQVNFTYTGEPKWMLWGNPQNISYDAEHHEWINDNYGGENVFRAMDSYEIARGGKRRWTLPDHVPEKKQAVITFRQDFYRKPEVLYAGAIFASTRETQKRRFVLINPEAQIWEPQYRAWAHLGLLYVGTAARREGWDVVVWDEHNQGHANLEELVEPGDIVGFSMVVSGVKRGADLAYQAKQLGAKHVICGNDSAIFRAKQLLELPGNPVDAVFTTNSLDAVRLFFRQIAEKNIRELNIPGVSTSLANVDMRSNQSAQLLRELVSRKEANRSGGADPMDTFIVPDFDLYPQHVWDEIVGRYTAMYGHKHLKPEEVRNSTVMFAQGCTRTQGKEACLHCTIAGVADIRIPNEEFWEKTLEAYSSAGFNTLYNVTDSAFEMRSVALGLKKIGARFNTLTIYGRAWGLAHHPELLDIWGSLVDERIMINCGMESADDKILRGPMGKAAQSGSRAEENRKAILNIRAAGQPIHLHYSLIYGSPGETVETCEKNLEFVQWSADMLGSQLDIMESDIFWVNPGAPSAQVMENYEYARNMAQATTGKSLSREVWYKHFGQFVDELMYPLSVEDAWYYYFTGISREQAEEYNRVTGRILANRPGMIRRRSGAFRAEADRT